MNDDIIILQIEKNEIEEIINITKIISIKNVNIKMLRSSKYIIRERIFINVKIPTKYI